MSLALINALRNPANYPHPVENIEVIETHISWVVLTGPFAYKIKKPVDFGFLNFATLAARQHFCGEELRLNQRLTEGLYLEVINFTGSEQAPQFNGQGETFEVALKMRQFPQSQLLDQLQSRGELLPTHIDELASQIAQFHQSTPVVATSHELCSAQAIVAPMRQNFEQIRAMLSDKQDLAQLDALEAWTESSIARLEPLLNQRAQEGAIRECHGDIHLGNAAMLDGKVVLFDCIEFNEPFRLIDIASDAAFLAMDLEDRGLRSLARRFINGWLEATGDYQALQLLKFYKAYRALVRAKVSLFRLNQEQDPVQRAVILRQYRRYAALAEEYSAIPSRFLFITSGVSAVGKSQVSLRLVEAFGAIRLRSDVERKRLFGPSATNTAIGSGIYSQDASSATYQRLREITESALAAGFPVVVDATFLKQAQREAASLVAHEHGVPFLILDCHAPEAVIASWLLQRQQEGSDPSDATLEVIKSQQASREPIAASEQAQTLRVDTQDANALDALIEHIRQRLPGI